MIDKCTMITIVVSYRTSHLLTELHDLYLKWIKYVYIVFVIVFEVS